MVHVGLELAIRLSCCFIPRDDAAGDANQPNPDYAETEVDPKTPMVDLGTPGSLDETPLRLITSWAMSHGTAGFLS